MKAPRSRWHDPEARRFVLFLLVGGLNTLVGYGLFAAAIAIGLRPAAALTVATLGGVAFNFQSIGRIVFAGHGSRRLAAFMVVYGVQFALNLAGLKALAGVGFGPLAAQAVLLPFMAVGSFLAMRRFVFAAPDGEPPSDRQPEPSMMRDETTL